MKAWRKECDRLVPEEAQWNWSFFHLNHQYHELLCKEIERQMIERRLTTFSQFLILLSINTIYQHPMLSGTRPTGRAIAKFLLCTEASISRLVNRLSVDGYITMTQDPERRSANILELTAKGKKTLEACIGLITEILDDNLKHIPKNERAIIQKYLAASVLKLDPSQQLLCGIRGDSVVDLV